MELPARRPRRCAYRRALLSALFCMLLAGTLTAREPPAATADRPAFEEMDRRPGEGERCLVCGQRIEGAEVAEIRFKGRTFHVKADMLDEFAADPDAYFKSLEARGALFDEQAMEGRPSLGWLIFGVYVFIGLVAAAVAGTLAVGRGLPVLPWFFAGLVGNVAALVVLLAVGKRSADAPEHAPLTKVPTTRAPVPCPHCAADNHPSASRCSSCGQALDPTLEAEAART